MLEFYTSLSEWQFYALLFTTVTVMALLSRGWDAVRPNKGLATSGVVNFVFLKSSVIVGGLFGLVVVGADAAYDSLGLPSVPRAFWDGVPYLVIAFVLLAVYDFSLYWIHRWLHKPLLWPMHAVHHSDEHLHFLSWSRGHPLEQSFIAACLLFSSTWVGLSLTEVAGVAIIRGLHQYYVHSNIDWDHGPLKHVIASPRFHRWHHVDHPDAYDKNFASIFPVLDHVFGTYHNPHSAKDMPTGFEGTPGNNLVGLFTYPFMEWARMWKARRKAKATTATADA